MTKSCPPPLTSKSAELSREEQARALCLRLLTARARTRAELAEQLGQGKENARNFLLENTDVANEIEKKIKEKLGIGAVVTDELTDDGVLPAPVDF